METPGQVGAPGGARLCLQAFALPTLEGLPMRSPETDTMFVPDFFGHAGECCCGLLCKMHMTQTADGMQNEYSFMPNGNSRAMQWFAWYYLRGISITVD
eukprot:COSAG01_NODE_160_length_23692_cov_9.703599_6_plen_99_part_00